MIRDYLELWVGAVALIGAVVLGIHTASAGSQSTFRQLRELDQRARYHELASERLERMVRRWEESFEGELQKGRLAERAAGRLRRQVTDQLVAWEKLHRRIRRNAHRWPPGRARDLARLLKLPESETLRRRKETFKTIGQLRSDAPAPSVLLRERARLTVELAEQRSLRAAIDAERKGVIERARAEGGEAIEEGMRRVRRRLDETFEHLIDHETGEDFHRRKGTLLPPVSSSPAARFGRRPRMGAVTSGRATGLTYSIDTGTAVRAVADGLVVLAKRFEGYGNLVIIDHGDEYHSLYAHLQTNSVEVGSEINRGTEIGVSGTSDSLDGPKLYLELRHDGEPIDPEPWFVR